MKRLLLAALVASLPAQAQNLRMGVGAQITSADPHFHNISPNNAYASMVFDNLLETDAKARLISSLAESWKPVGEDAWEFTLRRGVRFHNGSDFTAEDVAFTLERIPQVLNSPGSFRTYTQAITGVEIIDSHTLRLRTNGPAPLLPTDLAQVPMLDRETHQGATTEDFNAGRAAIGTGPYRMMAYRSGDRIDLQRFDGHWRGRPAWQSVDYRMITNDAGRTAALLAGDVDIIDQVATSDIERLRRDQRIALSEIDSMRFIYFALDHMRDGPTPFITDNDGKPFDRNPLKDVRVRRALSLAIDRPAIVARVMEGAASATRQVMPEGAFGYVPELAATRADPDQAKKLLAEAGYPNGFRLTLHGPNVAIRMMRVSRKRSGRCGHASAFAPRWMSRPMPASSPRHRVRNFRFFWCPGAVQPANPWRVCGPSQQPMIACGARVRSIVGAIPIPSLIRCLRPPRGNWTPPGVKPWCVRQRVSRWKMQASSPPICRRISGPRGAASCMKRVWMKEPARRT